MAVNNDSEKPVRAADSVSSSPSRGSSDGIGATPAADIEYDVEKKSIEVAPELPPPTGHVGGAFDQDARETGAAALSRTRSRGSSTRSRAPSVVPRSQRRGLFAQLALVPEVNRPFDYSNKVKWTITIFVAIAAAAAPLGSAIFFPALPAITRDFGVSSTIVNLSVAFYMLSMSIFPLWWSSFSETLGRRTIYLVSFALNVVFCLIGGFSVNIAMLIVFRILAGGASASVQAVGAGTISDIWEPRERGRAMGMFYLGPLMGPLLAPIIGGVLAEAFGWRSTLWFLTAFGAVVFALILFALPETLPIKKPAAVDSDTRAAQGAELSRVSTTRSVQVRTKRLSKSLKRFFIDPLQVVTYLRFPAVAITVYYASITFGALYVLNVSVQSAFSEPPYGYSSIIVGLLYLPGSLGYFIASLLGGRWIDRIMIRAAEKAGRYDEAGKLLYLPEDRMRENAWISATLFPGALIWYGWSVQNGVHWIVPGIANFFFGLGSMLVFSAATTMLTEFMPRRSSSGVALNNFVRNIFSCTGGVIGQPLINVMGHGWLMTMLGLVAWLSGNVCIWLLRRNSRKWREQMDKALNQ
ncbi:MFS multidrug resistance transporter [Apiospora saccharicola]|uniref:MFS multidrug resistance transporter n=1 Tax=Apiospora saccharicola TaxID=335842 RepID=A0ABR1TKR9_9PEZI